VQRSFNTQDDIFRFQEFKRMRKFLASATILAAIAAAAPVAQAQSQSAISYGVSGGLTLPIGNFGDFQGSGLNVQGHALYKPGSSALSFRGDLGVWTTSGQNSTFRGVPLKTEGTRFITVNANAIYNFEGAKDATFVPYVIGGAGLYNGNRQFGTNFGINAGGGVTFKLASFDAFAEARLHNVFGDGGSSRLIPISFGITFKP
jgi:opacity protein-like surface antigen